MEKEKIESVTISIYPSQRDKVERIMRALRIRNFSSAIQRLVADAPEPQPLVENGQAAVVTRP